jgi:hypothetical protein
LCRRNPIGDLCDLTQYRKVLVDERTSEVNQLHKIGEEAGVRLASVRSDIFGLLGSRHARDPHPRHH